MIYEEGSSVGSGYSYPNLSFDNDKAKLTGRLRTYVKENNYVFAERTVPRYERQGCDCNHLMNYTILSLLQPRQTIVVVDRGNPREEEKENRTALGIYLSIFAIGMSFFVGMEVKTVLETRQDLHKVRKYSARNFWDLSKVEKFCIAKRDQAYVRLGIKVALLASAAIGAIGAFVASTPLIVAGVAFLVVSAAFLAFNWGYHLGDEAKNSVKAKQLIQLVNSQ